MPGLNVFLRLFTNARSHFAGSVGRALAKAGDSDGDPLVACLDACHQSIQSRLFAFLDESIIKAEKPSESTNRSVVDALLRKKAECAVLNEVGFPSLLISKFQSFEEGGTQPINHGLDATYAKILRATFDSIESSASEDSKRASRIRLINYAHLAEHLRGLQGAGAEELAAPAQVPEHLHPAQLRQALHLSVVRASRRRRPSTAIGPGIQSSERRPRDGSSPVNRSPCLPLCSAVSAASGRLLTKKHQTLSKILIKKQYTL